MSSSKRNLETHPYIGVCIYCGEKNGLSDEHIIPYGLGGNLVLKKASCKSCAKITAKLEQTLLRGHWWPYRKVLNIQTRSGNYPKYQPAELIHPFGPKTPIKIKSDDYPIVVFLDFDIPSILIGKKMYGSPYTKEASLKFIGQNPSYVLDKGVIRLLRQDEKVEYPISFESSDILRFVAKVAHGISIYKYGLDGCKEYFLPKLILGNGDGALTYIGGCSSEILKPVLPGKGLHSTFERVSKEFRIVNVQLFRDSGDPPPIYEAIVGTIK